MPRVLWKADAGGRYWIDVVLGNRNLAVLVDLGLVDPRDQVGLEVDPTVYSSIQQSGGFSRSTMRSRRDASGRLSWFDTGLTTAQLVCPLSQKPAGPVVQVFVGCAPAGVPNRVGVVFFHRLTGCRVTWELDQQTWCIDYP